MRIRGQRTAVALTVLAVVAGGLAAWLVQREIQRQAAGSGPRIPVLVAAQPIDAGAKLEHDSLAEQVAIVDVPANFAPPDALSDPVDAAGRRTATSVPQGGYLTSSALTGVGDDGGYRLRRGERAISIDATSAPDDAEPTPGAIVDVLASGLGGAAQTEVLVTGAEVLAVSASEPATTESTQTENAAVGPQARLTIRVSVSQMASVVRADVFARELRAVVR